MYFQFGPVKSRYRVMSGVLACQTAVRSLTPRVVIIIVGDFRRHVTQTPATYNSTTSISFLNVYSLLKNYIFVKLADVSHRPSFSIIN